MTRRVASYAPPAFAALRLRRGKALSARLLSRIELPSRVQLIEIQQRVEHEEIAAFGLTAPDRVVRERYDVPFVERHVDDGGVLRDLVAVFDEAGDEQVFRIGVPQDDARPLRRRN